MSDKEAGHEPERRKTKISIVFNEDGTFKASGFIDLTPYPLTPGTVSKLEILEITPIRQHEEAGEQTQFAAAAGREGAHGALLG